LPVGAADDVEEDASDNVAVDAAKASCSGMLALDGAAIERVLDSEVLTATLFKAELCYSIFSSDLFSTARCSQT